MSEWAGWLCPESAGCPALQPPQMAPHFSPSSLHRGRASAFLRRSEASWRSRSAYGASNFIFREGYQMGLKVGIEGESLSIETWATPSAARNNR